MSLQIDTTFVDVWTELLSLRERGEIEELDEKYRDIIFAVAAAEARGEKINLRGLLKTLKPKFQVPMLSRINALVRNGWLRSETDSDDRRTKNLSLTPRSVEMVNLLSATIKKVVKNTSAVVVGGAIWLNERSDSHLLFLETATV